MSGYRTRAQQLVQQLDETSRVRELTYTESLLLERSICIAEGKKIPHGLTRALARRGIRRDMSPYREVAA